MGYDKQYYQSDSKDNRGSRKLFDVTCDKCGDACQVPFKPSQNKPVYCNNCFEKSDDKSGNRYSGHKSSDNRRYSNRGSDRNMYNATCDNCGKSCQVPFKPTGRKPIYCNDCFGKDSKPGRNQSNQELENKLDQIDAKLDQVLYLLSQEVFQPISNSKPKSKPKSKTKTKTKTESKTKAKAKNKPSEDVPKDDLDLDKLI